MLQLFQALQQSANAASMPSPAACGWYLSFVKLARDGTKRDEALSLECANYRSQHLGSHIRGLLECLSIVDHGVAVRLQAQARQHPHHGGVMPAATTSGRYCSSVQLVRQRPARNEASRPKLPNGRDQSTGAGVRGPLIG